MIVMGGMVYLARYLCAMGLAFTMAACGGGGSGGTTSCTTNAVNRGFYRKMYHQYESWEILIIATIRVWAGCMGSASMGLRAVVSQCKNIIGCMPVVRRVKIKTLAPVSIGLFHFLMDSHFLSVYSMRFVMNGLHHNKDM